MGRARKRERISKSRNDAPKPAPALLKGEKMNPQNCGSLPACQRLVEAGIVLETEAVWATDGCDWRLMSKDYIGSWLRYIPAPLMVEVWRDIALSDVENYWEYLSKRGGFASLPIKWEWVFEIMSNLDRGVDLLIWVRQRKEE